MGQSAARPEVSTRRSLGERLLPSALHEQLQFDRHPICRFLRQRALPLLHPGATVLDAGSGRLPEQYLRREILASGATLRTCDRISGPGVDVVADVSQLPFTDASFDVVLCTQVLEHVRAPAEVCRELARVLRPGGHLFLTAPQSSHMHDLPHNYFNYTRFGLSLLVRAQGLQVVHIEPQGGHFLHLGQELHYTSRVISDLALPEPLKPPLELASRILFGLITKWACLKLDRLDRTPLNPIGWNVECVKPCGEGGAAA